MPELEIYFGDKKLDQNRARGMIREILEHLADDTRFIVDEIRIEWLIKTEPGKGATQAVIKNFYVGARGW